MISVHGLLRGHNLELGRDADTGGQTKYVVELATALAAQPGVDRIDLLTRQVFDPNVADDYSIPHERIAGNAQIVRLPFGPRRYLRKEVLWAYLDVFADHALKHVRTVARVPDVIHSHYADAGYVGMQLAGLLDVPLIHTGHSLGRIKRKRLLEKGAKEASIEKKYNISRRIKVEETVLSAAARVIASTRQEIDEQYAVYDYYDPERMVVIPPGIDIDRFYPPERNWKNPPIGYELARFLQNPNKPIILALSRPDERKNIGTLVHAYANNPQLRERSNLVIVAGNRDRIQDMEKGPRNVLGNLLLRIDEYDLYGSVAYPKRHRSEEIPDLYRLASRLRGVFINPAITEPFGLTLIEAAASRLPVVATQDGGPLEIIANCNNGLLVDPLDSNAIADALLKILSDKALWMRFANNGYKGAQTHYTWLGHARTYLKVIRDLKGRRRRVREQTIQRQRLVFTNRALISDVDDTLLGDNKALLGLLRDLHKHRKRVAFGVATGRRIESAVKVLEEWSVPIPDLLITSVGSEIHYGPNLTFDQGWAQLIDYRWNLQKLRELMDQYPGLKRQPKIQQGDYKLSYYVHAKTPIKVNTIIRHLHQHDLQANVIYSRDRYLDLLPIRASKGNALRYFADKWNIPLDNVLVAGDSGNDEDMIRGTPLGVVVGNHHADLSDLSSLDRVYFANGFYAQGILEGIKHFDFFGRCDIPLQ